MFFYGFFYNKDTGLVMEYGWETILTLEKHIS